MKIKNVVGLCLILVIMSACKSCKDKKATDETPTETPISAPGNDKVFGFGVLSKVKGIWNGPVSSTTGLGSYPQWIVDFRPISENQISAKNELDSLNDIFMSFFIVKYNNEFKVAFRNGGSFVGMKRSSYMLADSVSETVNQSFYRFSEIVKGKSRAYSEVIRKGDSLILKSYTNKTNTLPTATPHMTWRSKLQDTTSTTATVSLFNFPKATITKDFSSTFVGQTESIYYASSGIPAGDPYPETAQPYLGKTTVSYTYDASHIPNSSKKVFIFIMTQPLFSGPVPNLANLKYLSRYVTLAANDTSFEFNYMHPGTYYAYVLYDTNNDGTANTGDWLSTANLSFTLNALGTTTVTPQINFTIP